MQAVLLIELTSSEGAVSAGGILITMGWKFNDERAD